MKVEDKNVSSLEELDNMVDYIHNQINNEKNPIAVHCSGGKGRTGTMLAAYLIKVQNLNAGQSDKREKLGRGQLNLKSRKFTSTGIENVCLKIR
ncbi:MAG: dual specificity protein phosphatase family protein [Thermoproteota archaeon]|nr:dual specificity protein phosphatase family protein [Thermoproteota archaeon]